MFSSKKKRITYLRSIWGKPVDKYRNFDLIALYNNLLNPAGDESFVDEKTWNDLDFNSFFAKIDRNITVIGQQYLYYLMHKYENDEKLLKKRFELILYLKNNQSLRERIQLSLFGLSDYSSYFMSSLFLSGDLPSFKYYRVFYLCSIISGISITLISFNGMFLFTTLAIILINLILNKMFSKRIYEYFNGFAGLNSLIISATAISQINTGQQVQDIEYLNEKRKLLKSLKKKLGYLVIDKASLNEFARLSIEYLNMFLLFDIITYYRSVNILIKNQREIRSIFESVANLDVSISIASYLAENPLHCNPKFNDAGSISFKNMYHPLIQDAVPNNIENLKNSVLITGSNMSGKTTFIKTTGINFILSQTLYFSLSEEFDIPMLIVKSSIRREENLEEGKSYFFVEIDSLNNFIKLSEKRNKYLFLIDEIFRGTNTIERLASSTAVLKYLNLRNKAFVTTHDIELQDLLNHTFRMYHFSEQVEDGKFFFDYKIKEGPCSSGNAIKLLELMKYPESIIIEAKTEVKKLLLTNRQ